jgi:hypothetical protein
MGELVDPNVASVRSMGGTGSAYSDPYHSNFFNPAALALLNGTSYELGIYGKNSTLNDRTNKSKSFTGSLEYLSIAFPLHNNLTDAYEEKIRKYKFGMGFRLRKYSDVGYDITSSVLDENFGGYTTRFNGNGGSYIFQWANAMSHKNFSIGVNLGYLFGKTSYARSVVFDSIDFAFENNFSNNNRISGFVYNVGAMYNIPLGTLDTKTNKRSGAKSLQLGVTFNSATGFHSSRERFNTTEQRVSQNSGIIAIDTVAFDTLSGSGRLPFELNFGINYIHSDKLGFAIELGTAAWSKYFNDANQESEGSLRNSLNFGIGGWYRTDYKSFNFWKRTTYRYGFKMRKDPRIINNQGINDFAFTFGAGMPFIFQRSISHINLGFEIGSRGSGTPIKENFIKINLGATFNDDEWFIKRKYD